MADFDRSNTGIISRNLKKTDPKRADMVGTINIDGVEYFLDGYTRERKDGSGKFLSLRAKRKDKQSILASGMPPTTAREIESDEIPF